IHGNQVIPFGLPARIDGPRDEELVADEARILAGRDDRPDDFGEEHISVARGSLRDASAERSDSRAIDRRADRRRYAFAPTALPIGSVSSRLACGRGMTCTDTSSPTRRAAAAPASVAALTAATSPRTIAVTYPAPIFSQPTSVTFAAFTIASAASIIATSPFVS